MRLKFVGGFILCLLVVGLVWWQGVGAKPAGSPQSTNDIYLPHLPASIHLSLDPVLTNMPAVTAITHAGDERLFIAKQPGFIYILDSDGTLLPTPFLDISDQIQLSIWFEGIMGLVFHPNYANNGYFYVTYTDDITTPGQIDVILARFQVSSDPNIADPTPHEMLRFSRMDDGHNGGDMHFGPDGYLYVSVGDGALPGDPENRAQDGQTLYGKILRLNVDNTPTAPYYTIPADNPFVGDPNYRDEIWSLGWRNPWRFSFDTLTGDMFISDVGWSNWEEINQEPAGFGGQNYGWNCYEGNHATSVFSPTQCTANYIFPIHEYPHSPTDGCSIIGGHVYRGATMPRLNGLYIFTDYCNSDIQALRPTGNGWLPLTLHTETSGIWSTFGIDSANELYLADRLGGIIYRLAP